MRKIDWLLASAAFLFCVTSSLFTDAGVTAAASARQNASTDDQAATADHQQVYAGTIVSMNGARFILRDDANDTWYHLDDQQTAGKFLGKKVLVTGKLDTATDVIHVRVIEEAKA